MHLYFSYGARCDCDCSCHTWCDSSGPLAATPDWCIVIYLQLFICVHTPLISNATHPLVSCILWIHLDRPSVELLLLLFVLRFLHPLRLRDFAVHALPLYSATINNRDRLASIQELAFIFPNEFPLIERVKYKESFGAPVHNNSSSIK